MFDKNLIRILKNNKIIEPILVLGDVGIDKYTYGEVIRISPEAPVPILNVTKEERKLGLAANVANNLSALGAKVTLAAVVGDDKKANTLEQLLDDCKISSWGIVREKNRVTTFKERVLTGVQQICRIDYEETKNIGQETELKFLSLLEEFSKDHSCLLIEDYAKGLLTDKVLKFAIKIFKDRNKPVYIDPSRNTDPLNYKYATLLKPNLIEAKLMAKSLGYRDEGLEEIAAILVKELHIEKLVITLGKDGMAFLDTKKDNKLIILPTLANEVFDVSGAGDTAIATIALALINQSTLFEACLLGNLASGIVVGKKGTAILGVKEIESFIKLRENFLKDEIFSKFNQAAYSPSASP